MNRGLFLLPLLSACGGSGGQPDATAGPTLHAEGTASMTDTATGRRVECSFFADIGMVVADAGGWTGDSIGEVYRTSFEGDDPSFGFQALMGGPVSLVDSGGSVEVRLVGDQPDDAQPFWLELEVITGTRTAEMTYEGSWTCAQILPDPSSGDHPLEAPGTWVLVPIP